MRAPGQIWNAPNLLTLLRLLCLPAIIALFRFGEPVAASGLFLIVMISDCFDGWIARRLNQCTPLGLYLDPVVDKIVVLALFYELARAGLVPIAAAHLFLARELLQTAVRSTAAVQGTVVGANWMGKTKAVLQTILLAWGLAMPALVHVVPPATATGLQAAFVAATWIVLAVAWCFFGVFVYWNRRLF